MLQMIETNAPKLSLLSSEKENAQIQISYGEIYNPLQVPHKTKNPLQVKTHTDIPIGYTFENHVFSFLVLLKLNWTIHFLQRERENRVNNPTYTDTVLDRKLDIKSELERPNFCTEQ